MPLPGRRTRVALFNKLFAEYERAVTLAKSVDGPLLLMYGFSRSGTSYLQNHISVYFADNTLSFEEGRIWGALAKLKHMPEFFKEIHTDDDCIKVVIPLRSLFDALLSWCVYDPEMLNPWKLEQAVNWYDEGLRWVSDNHASGMLIPIAFEAIKSNTPLSLAKAIASKTGVYLDVNYDMTVEEVFIKTNLGDSTGYDSSKSLATPLKSHIPNSLKNRIGEIIRDELMNMLDEKKMSELEEKRKAILSTEFSIG